MALEHEFSKLGEVSYKKLGKTGPDPSTGQKKGKGGDGVRQCDSCSITVHAGNLSHVWNSSP